MGMAASQARFLSLTARKSNVEYEGQQVNQQRTALANESANLYNKLTSLDIPTPPTTSDYYETVYTFTTSALDTSSQTGSTEYTLEEIYTMPEGNYARLTYTAYQWQSAINSAYSGDINQKTDPATGAISTSVSLANGVTKEATEFNYQPSANDVIFDFGDGSNVVSVNGQSFQLDRSKSQALVNYDSATGTCDYTYDVKDLGEGKYAISLSVKYEEAEGIDPERYYSELAGTQYEVTENADGTFTCTIPSVESEISGKYVDKNGNTNSAISYFGPDFLTTKEEGAANSKYNQPVLGYTLNDQTYFISAQEYMNFEFNSSSYVQNVGHPEEVSYPCTFSTAANGRYQTLTVTDDNGITMEFDLQVQNVQNEAAYNQAMLDYEYEQARYQKQVADINAKTEKLQQQDRTLELRLKQLDTEQNAISTEMDAVKKVIEDNVESTFKTFA